MTITEPLATGWRHVQAGNHSAAELVCRRVVEVDPTIAQAWYLLGVVTQLQGKAAESIGHYERAIGIVPELAEAWNNLGLALFDQGQVDEALVRFRQALRLKPDYPDAFNNLGNALGDCGQLDEAADAYQRALALRPDYADAWNNLGNARRSQGRLDEALASYEQAIRVAPEHAQAHLSRALAWLETGDFARGWSEYEWRWKCKEYAFPAYRQPRWDGSALGGRPILLHADHGLGDTLQFLRFAPLVRERGGRVIVACQKSLARIAAMCPGVERVVSEGDALPEFAVHAPLMSLPGILGTTPATIPCDVPYLMADPDLVAERGRALRPMSGFKVGVAWQGNPGYRRDRQRSFRLAQLEPVARVEGVCLVSLQVGPGREQIEELGERFTVTDLGAGLFDFLETAAILKNLDLLIAPDTALAHLAGGLGVPVWLALPFAADWRWLRDREDSPWYPTMRLFRQTKWGDWDGVFERMADLLATELKTAAARTE